MGKIRSTLVDRVNNSKFKPSAAAVTKLSLSKRSASAAGRSSNLTPAKSNSAQIRTSWSSKSASAQFPNRFSSVNSGKITKSKDKSWTANQQRQHKSQKKRVSFSPVLTTDINLRITDKNSSSSTTPRGNRLGIRRFDDFQKLLDGAADKSAASTKTILKSNVKVKKTRQKFKRESFRKKIDLIKHVEKQKKEADRRKKTVVVGDMQPLLSALTGNPNEDLSLISEKATSIAGQELSLAATQIKKSDPNLGKIPILNPTIQKAAPAGNKRKMSMKKRQIEIAEGLEYFAVGLKKL